MNATHWCVYQYNGDDYSETFHRNSIQADKETPLEPVEKSTIKARRK